MTIDATQAQLFVDDGIIESHALLHRTIHRPKKFGPVIRPDRPWEGSCIVLYGSVIRWEGKYMIWYQTFNKVEPPGNTLICYAESHDGVHWGKPNLGHVTYLGSSENNIVLVPPGRGLDSPSVILDEEGSSDRRFKMLYHGKSPEGGSGLFASYSGDGKRWTDPSMVAPGVGDRTNLMLDPGSDRPFVAFTRKSTMMKDHLRRVIYRSDSRDFEDWSEPELVLVPDLGDSHDLQFYGMCAFPYANMYLGFVQCLHTSTDINDVQLVSSRDGRCWSRTQPRDTFIGTGRSSDWETTWISFSSSPPIAIGERLWLYYEDRNASHGEAFPFPRGYIGLATMRLDGFASLDAGPSWGWVTTRELIWPGGNLIANINSKAAVGTTDRGQTTGKFEAELLSQDGRVLDGFGRTECRTFTGDSTAHVIEWDCNRSTDELTGKIIKIRFHILNSQLFSFRFS